MVALDPSFCPQCGTELGNRQVEGRDRPFCPSCSNVVWRNPVPTAGVAVVDAREDVGAEPRVLLVERADEPDAGEWGIPAGFLEHDESAAAGAARELHEETGLRVDPSALSLLSVDSFDHPTGRLLITVGYVVSRAQTTGALRAGSDAAAADFWTLSDLAASGAVLRNHDHERVRQAFDRP